jgi:hypothetical protein
MRFELSDDTGNHVKEIKKYKTGLICGEHGGPFVPEYLVISKETWCSIMLLPDFQRDPGYTMGGTWNGMAVCPCSKMPGNVVVMA